MGAPAKVPCRRKQDFGGLARMWGGWLSGEKGSAPEPPAGAGARPSAAGAEPAGACRPVRDVARDRDVGGACRGPSTLVTGFRS